MFSPIPKKIDTRVINSLEKVFCAPELTAPAITGVQGARRERVAFQLALRCQENVRLSLTLEEPSALAGCFSLREVRQVPCDLPAYPSDKFALATRPGRFPDPLVPLDSPDNCLRLTWGNWHAVWVSGTIPEGTPAGDYHLTIHISKYNQLPPNHQVFEPIPKKIPVTVTVLPFSLPSQKLLNINWFHTDCIAKHYGVEMWSARHWELLAKYFQNMIEHGNNVLYTPLWSIPLDTEVGHQRPTCQLLDITEQDGQYHFDFRRFRRWVSLARSCGFEYFELTHFFSQWGAASTPKIIVNGQPRFDWHTPATGTDYSAFLDALLPALLDTLRSLNLQHKCFFHVSDEPHGEQIDQYRRCKAMLEKWVSDDEYPIIDALSDVEFYRQGVVLRPIPSTAALDNFSQFSVKQRWVYYCGNWANDLPNRFLGLPSIRSRIMGVLLYLYRIEGFLHWGYNFWFSQFSLDQNLNPWLTTDAGRGFFGGDPFNVYPGPEGPIDSLHFETFTEGLQDLRALQLLEEKIGREKTVALIQKGLRHPITVHHYPHENRWLLNLRKRINQQLAKLV